MTISTSIFLVFLALSGQVVGQVNQTYQVPRTPDGHPDLQGVWENNTITPVERPDVFGDKELLTDEDVAFIQQRIGEIMAAGEDALFGGGVLEACLAVKSLPTTRLPEIMTHSGWQNAPFTVAPRRS